MLFRSAASANQPNITGLGTLSSLSVAGVTTYSGNIVAASGTTSTNTTTGALIVTGAGGVGVGGDVWVGGNIHANIGSALNGNVLVSANLIPAHTGVPINLGTLSNPFYELFLTGNTVYLGNSVLGTDTVTGAYILTTAPTTASPTPITFVLTGNGTINTTNSSSSPAISAAVQAATTQTILSNIYLNSGNASVSTTTGALQVNGGFGLSGSQYFSGKIYAPNGTSGNPTYTYATSTNRSEEHTSELQSH